MTEVPPELDDAAILEATAAEDAEETEDTEDLEDPVDFGEAVEDGAIGAARALDGPPDASMLEPATPARRAPNGQAPNAHEANGRPLAAYGPQPNGHAPQVNGHAPQANGEPMAGPDSFERTATAPQLRRFIKSRAYVPMHELRRRFVINGGDDDVTPIDLEQERIYVGLPAREGSLLGELFRAGDIGYELSMDPIAPIVVGVYPMRPVPRG